MNKKRQMNVFVVMMSILGIFIMNLQRISNYYMEVPGIYKATYNFNDDEIGMLPKDWSIYSQTTGDSIKVIESFNEHKKVVELIDGDDEDWLSFNYYVPQIEDPITTGTVEWYWATNDIKTVLSMYLRGIGEGSGRMVILSIKNGEIEGHSVKDEQWVHMRIDFDCDKNKYDAYVNGHLKRENYTFVDGDIESILHINFYTSSIETSVNYIDAVGFSWDDEYDVGDNLNFEKVMHPIALLCWILFSGTLIISFFIIINPKVTIPFLLSVLLKKRIIKRKKCIQILNFIKLFINKLT